MKKQKTKTKTKVQKKKSKMNNKIVEPTAEVGRGDI